jgi:hypothetical protein
MNEPHEATPEDEKHRQIVAGLEDVLAGRTIPHSQIKEWANGLERAAHEQQKRTAATLRTNQRQDGSAWPKAAITDASAPRSRVRSQSGRSNRLR